MSWIPNLPDADCPGRRTRGSGTSRRSSRSTTSAFDDPFGPVELAPGYDPDNPDADDQMPIIGPGGQTIAPGGPNAWMLGGGEDAGIDYNDRTQNYGVQDATKGSYLSDVYFDFVRREIDFSQLDPSDVKLYSHPRADPYFTRPSGINVFDGDRPIGFDPDGSIVRSPASAAYRLYTESDNSVREYFQRLMYRAGLVRRRNPRPDGGWGDPFDADYHEAWRGLVELAQATDQPLMVLLRDRAAMFDREGRPWEEEFAAEDAAAGPVRPTAQIISEADATQLVEDVAQQQLGRKLSEQEMGIVTSIVGEIRDRMSAQTNAVIDQQMAGGGTVSQPDNPQTTAQGMVEEQFETESTAYNIARAFAQMVGMSGGG